MSTTTNLSKAIVEFIREIVEEVVADAADDAKADKRTASTKGNAAAAKKKAATKKKKEEEEAKVTVDDVRGALMRVIEKHGNDGATAVLGYFPTDREDEDGDPIFATKVSDIRKDQFDDVVEKCEAYLDENAE